MAPVKKSYPCTKCPSRFSRAYDLNRHISSHHSDDTPTPTHKCLVCQKTFASRDMLHEHIDAEHELSEFTVTNTAWKRRVVIYTLSVNFTGVATALYDKIHRKCKTFIRKLVSTQLAVKIACILIAEAYNLENDRQITIDFAVRARRFTVSRGSLRNLHAHLLSSFHQLERRIEDFLLSGSGWVIDKIRLVQFEVFQQRAIRFDPSSNVTVGGRRNQSSKLAGRNRYLVHTENTDNKCFLYALAAHWFVGKSISKKDLEKTSTYKQFIANNFDISGLTFPLTYESVSKFIQQNAHLNVTVNAISLSGDNELFPLTSWGDGDEEVNILFYESEKEKFHAYFITDVKKFLRKYYAGARSGYGAEATCPKCFQVFYGKQILHTHIATCSDEKKPDIQYVPPDKDDNLLVFKNYERKVKNPFTIYIDFETLQESPGDDVCKHCKKTSDFCFCPSSTIVKANLKPKCFALIVVNYEMSVMFSKTYIGDDAAEVAIKTIMGLKPYLEAAMKDTKDMVISPEERRSHKSAKKCYLCNNAFDASDVMDNYKVHDHNHLTGAYIGPAHNKCNLTRHDKKHVIPVLAHNMTNFDSCFLLQALNEEIVGSELKCIGGK